MKQQLTKERLHELLSYDADSGLFTWLVGRRSAVNVGDIAGSPNQEGYIQITIDGRCYKAHRLAWFYVYGDWPARDIDHVNRVKADNRISNLREVTRSENSQNRSIQKNNVSGYRGVSRRKASETWNARIYINGKQIYLGSFDCAELASAAYQDVAATLHTHRPGACNG